MARFAREAQVLASLNHPNIAAIYGVEEGALVLELVEGPTLAERIAQGPMPVEEALPIARQIAEAVEYAHEQGIIHRDLKPANIKLTPEGRVKVLDFGLAKLTEQSREGVTAPTQTMAIAGTPGYLAPEQLQGKPADTRSDIFAFGCVLYELLSGRRAFPGDTLAASLASTAMAEPKPIEGAPKELEKLVRRCLRKDPARRIQRMGAMCAWRWRNPKEDPETGGLAATGRPGIGAWAVAGALAAATTVALWAPWRQDKAPAAQSLRYQIAPPGIAPAVFPSLSPIKLGPTWTFVSNDGGPSQIWVRAMAHAGSAAAAGNRGRYRIRPGRPTAHTWDSSRKANSRRSPSRAARPRACAMPPVAAAERGIVIL